MYPPELFFGPKIPSQALPAVVQHCPSEDDGDVDDGDVDDGDVDQGDVDNGVEHDDEGKLGTRRLQLQRKSCISWGSSGVPRCSYSGVLMSSLLNKVKEYIQSCKRYN